MGREKKPGKKEKKLNSGKPSVKPPKFIPPKGEDATDEDDRNEYGALPNRDLKKNLGCG